MRKRGKLELWYLEWCDAVNFSNEWSTAESIINWAESEDWLIRQAGYIVKETREYIVVASQYNPKSDSEDQYAEVTKIPKTWIRKRKRLSTSFCAYRDGRSQQQ